MTTAELQKQILATGQYRTPPGALPPRRKNGFWTSFTFSCSLFYAMVQCSRYARKGTFTNEMWAQWGGYIQWCVERYGTELSYEGFENRNAYKGPVVYVANHMSLFETFVLPATLLAYDELAIVLKESLLRLPVMGVAFKTKKTIALGRENPREDLRKVIDEGTGYLRGGRSVILFPQGRRCSVFDPAKFNSMGVKLAINAGVPVVPIALQCGFLGVGKYTKDFGPVDTAKPVRFACGPVLVPTKETSKSVHETCTAFIADTLERWGDVPVKRSGGTA